MKIGIVLCTYNRPEYLARTLDSLSRATVPHGTLICIVDDASTDTNLIEDFQFQDKHIIINDKNSGIKHSLRRGISYLFSHNCDLVINLDSDALVRNDFIEVLTNLHTLFPTRIITGFHSTTKNANGTERHPIIEQGTGYAVKKSVGGINMAFDKDVYEKYILPALQSGGNWDHNACIAAGSAVCAVPSVVDHIGFSSSMNHNEAPDTAESFKPLHLPNVTLVVVDCVDLARAQKAVDESTKDILFGDVKVLSSLNGTIPHINSIEAYSRFMMKELHNHITTDYALIIQHDGYVKDYKAWDKEFLQYDYIGAPWWYKDGKNVGNGGFSLRSIKLLRATAEPELKETHPEDHHICRTYRRHLESKGIKFAPESVAERFSVEGTKTTHYSGQFGFHGGHVYFYPKETLVITQFQGLGDIIFSMNLIDQWRSRGMDILWPVDKGYLPIQKHYEGVTFVDKDTLPIDYLSGRFDKTTYGTVVPLYMAHQVCRAPYKDVMKSKYTMFGADWKQWRDTSWKRDREAEDRLFYEVLGLTDGEPYTLINTRFRTDQTGGVKIHVNSGKTIRMENIEGYTLFDWGKVIENAEYIHTVGTAINYIIELLDCKAKEIHLYIRRPDERGFEGYDYILTSKYKYIYEKK
jgi:glycosyltransferase involved in cell wall biosynthesis